MASELMIYGATGHTGMLLVRRAVVNGERPVLGGRNEQQLRLLADELGLEYRTARITEPRELARALQGIRVVLNAAGPFSITASQLFEACLRSRTHYLDVSGELGVFAALHQRDAAARERGVLVMPGVGFLVLASDCLAAHVAGQVPGPVSLKIALSRPSLVARGSRRTMLSMISSRVRIRRGGVLVDVPVSALQRNFDLAHGPVACVAISGAETLASFLTTGIPSIEVYAPATSAERAVYRLAAGCSPLLRTVPAQLAMRALSDCLPAAGNAKRRQVVVAVVENAAGQRAARRLSTPDAYQATTMMALAAVAGVLRGLPHTGFQTPGRVFGPELLFSLPGVSLEALKQPL
jgi:short subunit dehydrogenase-like uncharacterized protein